MCIRDRCIYVVARMVRSNHAEALDRAVLMAQGGEFAFVLFSAAASAQIIDATVNANLTAIVVLSMVLTPLFVIVLKRFAPKVQASMDGVEAVSYTHLDVYKRQVCASSASANSSMARS